MEPESETLTLKKKTVCIGGLRGMEHELKYSTPKKSIGVGLLDMVKVIKQKQTNTQSAENEV